MKNKDIREYAKERNICLWEIADELKINDITFSKMLRRELDNVLKTRIKEIIDKKSKERSC